MIERFHQKFNTVFGSQKSGMDAILAKIADFKANEVETLDAVSFSMDNPKQLVDIFDYQYYLLMSDEVGDKCTRFDQHLNLLLEALTIHLQNLEVLIKASLVLYGITRTGENNGDIILKNVTVKRQIVTALLNGIIYHEYNKVLIHYAFEGLMFFNTEKEKTLVMYEHKRFFQMSLYMMRTRFLFSYGLDNDIYMSNGNYVIDYTISSRINNEQKKELGDAGAIKVMVKFLKHRIGNKYYYKSVSHCWMLMQTLTRNVPDNCKRFLDGCGIICFLKTIERQEKLINFESKPDNATYNLFKDMFGVLRNVSQSENLRPRLMQVPLIKVLSYYLTEDKLLISYLSAEVIALLASDGHKAWIIKNPARYEVLDDMRKAMNNWDQDVIQYLTVGSITTILQLIQCRHTPQCVEWAVWTLERLTKVYPEKYCSIIVAAGGLKILNKLLLEDYTLNYQYTQLKVIHNLAQTLINYCESLEITAE